MPNHNAQRFLAAYEAAWEARGEGDSVGYDSSFADAISSDGLANAYGSASEFQFDFEIWNALWLKGVAPSELGNHLARLAVRKTASSLWGTGRILKRFRRTRRPRWAELPPTVSPVRDSPSGARWVSCDLPTSTLDTGFLRLLMVALPPDDVFEDEDGYEVVNRNADGWLRTVTGVANPEIVVGERPLGTVFLEESDRRVFLEVESTGRTVIGSVDLQGTLTDPRVSVLLYFPET